MKERAEAKLTLADLFADLDHPNEFVLDDWSVIDDDDPATWPWWVRLLAPHETLTWTT